MSRNLRFDTILLSTLIVTGTFLLVPGAVYPKVIPAGTKIDMVRFDAILELNAPILRTHVVLFVRYWVAPNYYNVAVVWAEPHFSLPNFPIYPPTLNINSNEQNFSIVNKVNTYYNQTFPKPLDERGVFRNKFNNYPLDNIRFAEPEALVSRIYTNDLGELTEQTNNDWQTIDVKNSTNQKGIDREVAGLKLRANNGRIDALNLLDSQEQLIKSIEYEYSGQKGQHLLHRQNVVLPERPMTVGFRKGGATVRIGDKKRTYKELPGTHHSGGRKCTVEYKPVEVDNRLLPLPARITVHKADTNIVLRTAKMYNFIQLKHSAEEAKQAATQFGLLDDKELKVRQLQSKYWLKDPGEIEDADVKVLKQLRKHFENTPANGKTVGEKLKRIDMLMELDWIQGDHALRKHFRQYLDILSANDLNQMILFGGIEVIDRTIQLTNFPIAEQLLKEWLETAIAACEADSILSFGQIQTKRRHYWTIAALLEECLKPSHNWGQKRFDAQALRSIALYHLSEIIKDPSKAKTNRIITQAAWASWSIGTNDLYATVNKNVADAKDLFADLDEPNRTQKALKAQLDQIGKEINQAKNKY